MRHGIIAVLLSGLLALPGLSPAQDLAAEEARPVASKAAAAKVQPAPLAKVNINSADAEALSDVLVGIGPAKAQAIVAYRKEKGGFKRVEELAEVKGIGEATLARNKDRILLK